MSSIEDLYLVSTNVSSPIPQHPRPRQPTIDDLQNELDQLHDKLDEITRENQYLKTQAQEHETIFEENEYLYAEKSRWVEELERARVRQLLLEQEIQSLREREKELIHLNDSTISATNPSTAMKLKLDWLKQTNTQLESEVIQLREENQLILEKFEQAKDDFLQKNEHYKKVLLAAQDAQQVPQVNHSIEEKNNEREFIFRN